MTQTNVERLQSLALTAVELTNMGLDPAFVSDYMMIRDNFQLLAEAIDANTAAIDECCEEDTVDPYGYLWLPASETMEGYYGGDFSIQNFTGGGSTVTKLGVNLLEDTGSEEMQYAFPVLEDWDLTVDPKLKIYYCFTSTATAKSAKLTFTSECYNDGEVIDGAFDNSTIFYTQNPDTAYELYVGGPITLTSGSNIAVGSLWTGNIVRDTAYVDNPACDMWVLGFRIQYKRSSTPTTVWT